jgi:branched-chain amino acid transport system permease protein
MDETLAPKQTGGLLHRVGLFFKPVPLLGYLLGFMACVLWEQLAGEGLTSVLGLPKMPVLFGLLTIFKVLAGLSICSSRGCLRLGHTGADSRGDRLHECHLPDPAGVVARAVVKPANALARYLQGISPPRHRCGSTGGDVCGAAHLGRDERLPADFLKLTLIAVLFTLSLNIINGYMGEFSCSHPGFMAIGAYMSSLFTVGLFASDKVLGDAVFNFPPPTSPFPWR